MYSYNSNHKIITAFIIIGIVTSLHFLSKMQNKNGNHYENGQIKVSGEKVNELNQGNWIWYYENGEKMMEGYFNEGKREGLWKQFDTEGKLIMTSNYKKNRLEGELIRFTSDGKIIEKTEYRQDTIYKKSSLEVE